MIYGTQIVNLTLLIRAVLALQNLTKNHKLVNRANSRCFLVTLSGDLLTIEPISAF